MRFTLAALVLLATILCGCGTVRSTSANVPEATRPPAEVAGPAIPPQTSTLGRVDLTSTTHPNGCTRQESIVGETVTGGPNGIVHELTYTAHTQCGDVSKENALGSISPDTTCDLTEALTGCHLKGTIIVKDQYAGNTSYTLDVDLVVTGQGSLTPQPTINVTYKNKPAIQATTTRGATLTGTVRKNGQDYIFTPTVLELKFEKTTVKDVLLYLGRVAGL